MMIADTDVLIDFLRGDGEGAERIKLELSTGRLATTAVNAFDLWAGASTDRESAAVLGLLDALRVLPVTAAASSSAGRIHRDLRARGEAIGMADSLIAGVCLAAGGLLITRNKAHFSRVDGLSLTHM